MFSGVIHAQKDTAILFKIDNEPVSVSEFNRMYNRQVEMLGSEDENSRKEYFNLFTNYKLKVKEAIDIGLDTVAEFKAELAAQRERLAQPYLKDEKASEYLIQEAFERTITEVNASHILVKLKPKATVQDTMEAFRKISELREKILKGADFEEMARKHSEDPSAKVNGGNLGYFSAFQMLYPFESAAYNTEIGAISQPFRTTYGYHIVRTNDFRMVEAEREVAHIMISDLSENGKSRIDSIATLLKKSPEKFEILAKDLSDDSASANSEGKLPLMRVGDAIESFEKIVFYELNEAGQISKPFNTEYGWHIAKLIKIHPMPSKDELYFQIRKKVLSDSRSSLEFSELVKRLEMNYIIVENASAVSDILAGEWSITDADKKVVVLSVNEENYFLEDFILFLKRNTMPHGIDAFKNFREFAIVDYYKQHLETSDESFKTTLSEFKEGMLLFNLMELEVWNPSKNVIDQRAFYETHKFEYKQPFEAVQGKVISDYQVYLEEQWVKKLKRKHVLQINSEELEKILNE